MPPIDRRKEPETPLDRALVAYNEGKSLPPDRAKRAPDSDPPKKKGRGFIEILKETAAVVGASIAILGPVGAAAVWSIDHWVVEPRLIELKQILDPLVLRPTAAEIARLRADEQPIPPTLTSRFAEVKSAIAAVKEAVDAPNNPASELGKKLDSVDKMLKALPTKPAPPPVGPTATREGRQ